MLKLIYIAYIGSGREPSFLLLKSLILVNAVFLSTCSQGWLNIKAAKTSSEQFPGTFAVYTLVPFMQFTALHPGCLHPIVVLPEILTCMLGKTFV